MPRKAGLKSYLRTLKRPSHPPSQAKEPAPRLFDEVWAAVGEDEGERKGGGKSAEASTLRRRHRSPTPQGSPKAKAPRLASAPKLTGDPAPGTDQVVPSASLETHSCSDKTPKTLSKTVSETEKTLKPIDHGLSDAHVVPSHGQTDTRPKDSSDKGPKTPEPKKAKEEEDEEECQVVPVEEVDATRKCSALDRNISPEVEVAVDKSEEEEEGRCWGRLLPKALGTSPLLLKEDTERLSSAQLPPAIVAGALMAEWSVEIFRVMGDHRPAVVRNTSLCLVFVGAKALEEGDEAELEDGTSLAVVEEWNVVGQYLEAPGAAFPTELLRQVAVGREVGSGSFGSVRLARRRRDSALVVLKIVRQSFRSRYQEKLMGREAKTVGRLGRHENVVAQLGVWTWSRTAFHLMEAAQGGDLHDRIAQCPDRRLPEDRAKLYSLQVFRGLEYLHGRGYAHRDLKTENVLLMERKWTTVVKLCDFGLSKAVAVGSGGSGLRSIVGTGEYMSPEVVAASGTYTVACDVWSAGVFLFKALSGDFPFAEPDLEDKILARDMFKRRAGWEGVTGAAWALVDAMIALDPTQRPALKTILRSAWFTLDEQLGRRLGRLGLEPLTTAQPTLHRYGFRSLPEQP